jgi:hypothetical protein
MTHQSRALNLASRRPVIRLLVLLGLVAAVVGGIVGWQRPLQGAAVDLFGVSDGVVCLRITKGSGASPGYMDLS